MVDYLNNMDFVWLNTITTWANDPLNLNNGVSICLINLTINHYVALSFLLNLYEYL